MTVHHLWSYARVSPMRSGARIVLLTKNRSLSHDFRCQKSGVKHWTFARLSAQNCLYRAVSISGHFLQHVFGKRALFIVAATHLIVGWRPPLPDRIVRISAAHRLYYNSSLTARGHRAQMMSERHDNITPHDSVVVQNAISFRCQIKTKKQTQSHAIRFVLANAFRSIRDPISSLHRSTQARKMLEIRHSLSLLIATSWWSINWSEREHIYKLLHYQVCQVYIIRAKSLIILLSLPWRHFKYFVILVKLPPPSSTICASVPVSLLHWKSNTKPHDKIEIQPVRKYGYRAMAPVPVNVFDIEFPRSCESCQRSCCCFTRFSSLRRSDSRFCIHHIILRLTKIRQIEKKQ